MSYNPFVCVIVRRAEPGGLLGEEVRNLCPHGTSKKPMCTYMIHIYRVAWYSVPA